MAKTRTPLKKVIPLVLDKAPDDPHYHRDYKRIQRKLDKLSSDEKMRMERQINRALKILLL